MLQPWPLAGDSTESVVLSLTVCITVQGGYISSSFCFGIYFLLLIYFGVTEEALQNNPFVKICSLSLTFLWKILAQCCYHETSNPPPSLPLCHTQTRVWR